MGGEVRLSWEGKRDAVLPDPPPRLCLVDAAPVLTGDSQNQLIQGDNLGVMTALLQTHAGQFSLIYLDPPFFTGKQWNTRTHNDQEANAQPPPLLIQDPKSGYPGTFEAGGVIENSVGFSDAWEGGLADYLQWLLDRLTVARSLLAPDGCIYLHLSWHSAHYAKLLMDKVFGSEQFQNEIVWCYREAINSKKRWNRKHDTLLFYSKCDRFTFNPDQVREPYSDSTLKKFRRRDSKGPYRLMGRGIVNSPLRSKRDLPPEMETLFPELTYRHYLGDGTLPVDYWFIDIENQASRVRTGYPTQKPEALLERILLASSNEGDLIGDFCCGSGTTLAVADQLGRRWIGCDSGAHAIATARGRLAARGAAFEERIAVP
jgi:site-specific DNA-methyltransferase (adenine-specific)/adenine-specific DNA-methyltransferase